MKFYLGTHMPQWLGRMSIPLFVARPMLALRKKLPRALGPWALDSGGFTEVTKHGGWKISARQYAGEVRHYRDEIGNLEWCAPQDWMCEQIALASTGSTVADHIRRTVENLVELRTIAPDLPFVPVLQGYALDDYKRCADAYDAAGINLASERVVGLGSVCRRQGTEEAVGIVFGVLRHTGARLHGFGFKMQGLDLAHSALASSDSLAWSFRGRRVHDAKHPHPRGGTSCANCPTFALEWRDALLARIPQPVQVPMF